MGGQFLGLGEAYIPNLSLLVCLEAFKKFVWWWWWGGGGGGGGGGLDQF